MSNEAQFFDENGVKKAMETIGERFTNIAEAYSQANEEMAAGLTTPNGAMYGSAATAILSTWDENSSTLDDFMDVFDNWSALVSGLAGEFATLQNNIYKVEGLEVDEIANTSRASRTTALKTERGAQGAKAALDALNGAAGVTAYDENGVMYTSRKSIVNGKIVESRDYGNGLLVDHTYNWDSEKKAYEDIPLFKIDNTVVDEKTFNEKYNEVKEEEMKEYWISRYGADYIKDPGLSDNEAASEAFERLPEAVRESIKTDLDTIARDMVNMTVEEVDGKTIYTYKSEDGTVTKQIVYGEDQKPQTITITKGENVYKIEYDKDGKPKYYINGEEIPPTVGDADAPNPKIMDFYSEIGAVSKTENAESQTGEGESGGAEVPASGEQPSGETEEPTEAQPDTVEVTVAPEGETPAGEEAEGAEAEQATGEQAEGEDGTPITTETSAKEVKIGEHVYTLGENGTYIDENGEVVDKEEIEKIVNSKEEAAKSGATIDGVTYSKGEDGATYSQEIIRNGDSEAILEAKYDEEGNPIGCKVKVGDKEYEIPETNNEDGSSEDLGEYINGLRQGTVVCDNGEKVKYSVNPNDDTISVTRYKETDDGEEIIEEEVITYDEEGVLSSSTTTHPNGGTHIESVQYGRDGEADKTRVQDTQIEDVTDVENEYQIKTTTIRVTDANGTDTIEVKTSIRDGEEEVLSRKFNGSWVTSDQFENLEKGSVSKDGATTTYSIEKGYYTETTEGNGTKDIIVQSAFGKTLSEEHFSDYSNDGKNYKVERKDYGENNSYSSTVTEVKNDMIVSKEEKKYTSKNDLVRTTTRDYVDGHLVAMVEEVRGNETVTLGDEQREIHDAKKTTKYMSGTNTIVGERIDFSNGDMRSYEINKDGNRVEKTYIEYLGQTITQEYKGTSNNRNNRICSITEREDINYKAVYSYTDGHASLTSVSATIDGKNYGYDGAGQVTVPEEFNRKNAEYPATQAVVDAIIDSKKAPVLNVDKESYKDYLTNAQPGDVIVFSKGSYVQYDASNGKMGYEVCIDMNQNGGAYRVESRHNKKVLVNVADKNEYYYADVLGSKASMGEYSHTSKSIDYSTLQNVRQNYKGEDKPNYSENNIENFTVADALKNNFKKGSYPDGDYLNHTPAGAKVNRVSYEGKEIYSESFLNDNSKLQEAGYIAGIVEHPEAITWELSVNDGQKGTFKYTSGEYTCVIGNVTYIYDPGSGNIYSKKNVNK